MSLLEYGVQETDQDTFRILQITDLHTNEEEYWNERTRADIAAMATQWRPDFLAVTGDIWCGDDRPETAPMWRQRDLQFFGSLGVPWSLAFGNHDYLGDWECAYAAMAGAPFAVMPFGDGRGDFRVEVRQGGRARWDLFFLNSGVHWNLPADLSWFTSETTRLCLERGTELPAVAFFHIPLQNYQQAIEEGRTIGSGEENVLGWGDDEGLGAPILKRPGNLRACFCGHSHKNDFYFVESGVIFSHGRATGYGGYGGEVLRKGGKLIELRMGEPGIAFKTVFGDGDSLPWASPLSDPES